MRTPNDWAAVLGPELADRARIDRSWSTAIGAGRWDEQAAFAVVATLGIFEGRRTLLVGLRHGFPYDALEVVAASSVAALLALAHSDNRAVAEEQRRADTAEARLALTDRIQSAFLALRDRGALLQETVRDLADRLGVRGTSVMLVEGGALRIGAAIGLASEAIQEPRQLGQGIAGWVAQQGERLVLHGRVTEERFHGTDPHAAESVVVPLRAGGKVLGVLNVKRGPGDDAFLPAELSLIDGVAEDLAAALLAMDGLAALERDRDSAIALGEIARLVAAGDAETALRVAVGALGHHAAAVLRADGMVVGRYGDADDETCGAAALAAAERAISSSGGSEAIGVGFARHGQGYGEDERSVAARAVDTLSLLGRNERPREDPGQVEQRLRVLAVEDHPVMRLGLCALLEREGFVVTSAKATCAEAVTAVEQDGPDVILLDLGLPDATGTDAVVRLRAAAPAVPIVVYSVESSAEVIREALRAGATGYMPKDGSIGHLVASLRAAAAGVSVLGGDAAAILTRGDGPEPHAGEPPSPYPNGDSGPREPLTPRELDLLRLLAGGHTNKEIAQSMVLAEDTVKKAVQTLIAKLGAADRTNAVVLAIRAGIID